MVDLKILFVCSGNSKFGIAPFIKSQMESLKNEGLTIDCYAIKGKGVLGYLKNLYKLNRQSKIRNYHLIHAHYTYAGLLSILSSQGCP